LYKANKHASNVADFKGDTRSIVNYIPLCGGLIGTPLFIEAPAFVNKFEQFNGVIFVSTPTEHNSTHHGQQD